MNTVLRTIAAALENPNVPQILPEPSEEKFHLIGTTLSQLQIRDAFAGMSGDVVTITYQGAARAKPTHTD